MWLVEARESLIDAIGVEDIDMVRKINECQLLMLDGSNPWESDLAALSVLSDSMSIFTKSLKGSNSQSEADILRKIIKKLSTICADSAAHTTIKFISLNGLGNLYLPSEADDLIQSNTIATSLLELFISVLESNTDDLILSEALQSTQRVISNLPTLPLAPHRKTFFDAVF